MELGFREIKRAYGRRFLLAAGLLIGAGVVFPTAAEAQSSACLSLQYQLDSLAEYAAPRPSRRYQQYDRAVRDQQVQIRKTERMAVLNGCRFLASNACLRIDASLSDMYANLAALKRERNRAAPRARSSERERRQIIDAMQRRGCMDAGGTETARGGERRRGHRTLLEQIFGVKTYSREGSFEDFSADPGFGQRYGTYRTLCVRTCDGYYFPISFSTTEDRFSTDEASCRRMCPGAETRLFIHKMPIGDPEDSISYPEGNPYISLENAFTYRRKLDAACNCNFRSRGIEAVAGAGGAGFEAEKPQARQRIATPTFRPDRDIDPESAANQAGGLTEERIATLLDPEATKLAGNRDGKVRIVGPVFFPVQ